MNVKMNVKMNVRIKRLHTDAIIPKYATPGAAGFDFHAIEGGVLAPGKRQLVKTGLAFEIPEGFELQVRPRSGSAYKQGLTVLNSPGTVDADFRGEVGVILINHGDDAFVWNQGDRIAQGVINKIEQAAFIEADDLTETDRGDGGFGSTNEVFGYLQY